MSDPAPIENGLVLFADDEKFFRESHASLLRRHGFECVSAADSAETLSLLHSREFDALVADIHMPGNAKLELVGEVARIVPGLPVVLLTGRPAVETAARSVRMSVTAYLTKPVDLNELLSVLNESILNYRRLRSVRRSRGLLQSWSEELGPIESALQTRNGIDPADATQDFLRVSLHNLMRQLADLDRSIAAWSRFDSTAADLRKLDLIAAIRRAIEVLEKSRQNFKSKELGELRRQLQFLISTTQAPPSGPTTAA